MATNKTAAPQGSDKPKPSANKAPDIGRTKTEPPVLTGKAAKPPVKSRAPIGEQPYTYIPPNIEALESSKSKDDAETSKPENEQITLTIIFPEEGFASPGKSLDVKVYPMRGKVQCGADQLAPHMGANDKISIIVDGKSACEACAGEGEAVFSANLNTKYMPEGPHTIKAAFTKEKTVIDKKIHDSGTINFILDRSAPFIIPKPPEQFIGVDKYGTHVFIVEAKDVHSGINLDECSVTINDAAFKNPVKRENELTFPLKFKLLAGEHKAKLALYDMAGNILEQELTCFVPKELPKIESAHPSGIVGGKHADISELFFKADIADCDLDIERCEADVNGSVLKDPEVRQDGLAFLLGSSPADGYYNVKFKMFDMFGNSVEHESDFTIERTPLIIQSVFPSNIVKVEDCNISRITVNAKEPVSGFDLKKCVVVIDGKSIKDPVKGEKGLIFPVRSKIGEGAHKMSVDLSSHAGNTAKYDTDLLIDKTPPVVRSIFFTNMIKVSK